MSDTSQKRSSFRFRWKLTRLTEIVIIGLFLMAMLTGVVYGVVETFWPERFPNRLIIRIFSLPYVGILATINLRTWLSGISLYRGKNGPVTRAEYPRAYWLLTSMDLAVLLFITVVVARVWK